MANILETYVEEIKKIFGEKLKSIILYGSKASGEDTKKHSDYNLLIIADDLPLELLKALSAPTAKWVKQGNVPPQLFTAQRLQQSTDVFPIEFHDIKSSHKVLAGSDPFEHMSITNDNLRHECEFELRGKLNKLRQGYMMYAGKPAKVKELLIDSVSTFLVLFKHTLQLLGITPPQKKLDALHMLKEKTGLPTDVFVTVMKMKQGDRAALKADADTLMQQYLICIEQLVDVVNNL